MTQPLVDARGLSTCFPAGKQTLTVFQNFNLSIFPGETLALVGESGCGKSTVGKTLLRLCKPSAGAIFFDGQDITRLSNNEMTLMRRRMQIIFQNPYSSLNPGMRVQDIIGEPLDIHNIATGNERKVRIDELLELVGMNPSHGLRYPHAFSGGQRQRIGIARALAVDPSFIVCDEPLSALDASTQVQILDLFKKLQRDKKVSYLFITHDLSMLQGFAHRVAVMYLGNIVELAETAELFENPQHPYTKALLSAIPIPDPIQERKRSRIILTGELPNPLSPPAGCPFHSRCPYAMPICAAVKPKWKEAAPGHFTACHYV